MLVITLVYGIWFFMDLVWCEYKVIKTIKPPI